MTEWELAYHRFLTSVKAAVSSQDQFWQRQMQRHWKRNCEAKTLRSSMKQWTSFWCFNERHNPYKVVGPVKLHHFISHQLYPAINQTAYCLFWGMGAKITWNFVKSVSALPKKIWRHYKANHSATSFAKCRKALSEIVMLQIHPWNDRKGTKVDGYCTPKWFSFTRDFAAWSDKRLSLIWWSWTCEA